MKPFNLEEYLSNPSIKVVTRDGRAVTRILCTDAKSDYPIIALVEESNGDELVISYTTDGEWRRNHMSDNDLFFAIAENQKHEGWINLYKNEVDYYPGMCIYPTKEVAESIGELNSDYAATARVEWEE